MGKRRWEEILCVLNVLASLKICKNDIDTFLFINNVLLLAMNIIYKPSAFEHNINEDDIQYAFLNPYYDGPIEEEGKKENRYIRLGFDRSGNLLEIMYNE